MARELLIASNNPDKLAELHELLGSLNLQLLSLKDCPGFPPTVEDRDSISGNAMKKALEAAQATGLITLADDTGLFIDALDDAPGVYTARFAGEGCSYADNRAKTLQTLEGNPNRKASFRTAIALASPEGIIAVAEGVVEGLITTSERGSNGFGYDSIFEINGLTYAEMDDDDKNACSHRAAGIRNILPILKNIFA